MKDEEAIPSTDGLMDRHSILEAQLSELRQRHRSLDGKIALLSDASAAANALDVRRLKKQKLALKDRIAALEDQVLPDIIA